MSDKTDSIANRIKEALELKGMKQIDLANETGIPKSSISSYVSGRYEPKDYNVRKIAQILNVNEEWLKGFNVPLTSFNSKLFHFDKTIDTARLKEDLALVEQRIIRIPVYESVPAGVPVEALGDPVDWEELNAKAFNSNHDYIGLIVKGDSMYPKYYEGDVVIVRVQPDCESGQDAVVYVNGYDATLKTVYKHENRIELRPINTEYPPKFFDKEDRIRIFGIVKELRRPVN